MAIGGTIIADDFWGTNSSNQNAQSFVLNQIAKLTDEQKLAFNTIADAINGFGKQKLFFVEGPGGCGMISLNFIQ